MRDRLEVLHAKRVSHWSNINMQPSESVNKKKPRKSRGKGLRTTSGCLTCRSRHKKCDERRPICGQCSTHTRPCIFPSVMEQPEGQTGTGTSSQAHNEANTESSSRAFLSTASVEALGPDQSIDCPYPQFNLGDSCLQNVELHNSHSLQRLEGEQTLNFTFSPDTGAIISDLWNADVASTRWLDLLAHDAALADKTFSLAPTRCPSPVPSQLPQDQSSVTSAEIVQTSISATASESKITANERRSWQLDHDISLQPHETRLLRAFIEHSASWLDVCDAQKHFSTHASRLALRNLGLMKAILAYTSRHALDQSGDLTTNLQEPLQYYYETLHYVQESLRFASYTRSEELLATVIIISTYEMLDDSRGDWQRHLKGVFGIQRSQDVNGASGGLRQAVWWAWLRQDLWAAFRTKRACFSFWRPSKAISDLTQDELTNRAVFLLSQAVNFAAHSESTSISISDKAQAGQTIMAALAEWQDCLGPAFRPLPTVEPENTVFKPLWLHPPHYALALQAYHFAKILVTLHGPAPAGFQGYMRTQRVLLQSVEVICGIAMELKDEGCQIFCSQCLFGAGLCTQDPKSRETIIALIETCGVRSGWPMANLTRDLKAEWVRLT